MTARVLAFVEGQTEEKFIREIVSPSLECRNVSIHVTTSSGVQSWSRTKKELLRYLMEDTGRFVTTMFDYYGLPSDWPGKNEAKSERYISDKAKAIERAIHTDISDQLGKSFDEARFLPYIQMYEFEALLFSDTGKLAQSASQATLQRELKAIVQECGEPEGINDNPNTAPSKRIRALVPGYQKVLHGILAAKNIGLPTMRKECPHFAQWLTELERLG